MSDAEQRLVGKHILAVDRVQDWGGEQIAEDGKYVRLTFDDGVAVFSGAGYDGLWDDVDVSWVDRPDQSA